MAPVIAVFGSFENNFTTLRQNYAQSIISHGGAPIIVPRHQSLEGLKKVIDRCDGFLFAGGGDIEPSFYGQQVLNSSVDVDIERDKFEFEAYKMIKETKKPILGICRGIQSLAVFEGADLYQDLPCEYKSYIYHKQTQKPHEVSHKVNIEKNTLLYDILKTDEIMTNSHHHQAVKKIPPSLSVCARCEDGIIEGLYCPSHPFYLLVQWHPEFSYNCFPSNKIFSAFVSSCPNE